MWSCSFTLLIAGIFGPQLFVTPIFGITPTVYVELIMYVSGLLTSHPVIAWNIYKYGYALFFIFFGYPLKLMQQFIFHIL